MLTGFESNFEKVSSSYATTQGVPYDYGSVMHYGAYAFTRNGQPTILPVQSSGVGPDELGQRDRMSASDLEHAKALYCAEGENICKQECMNLLIQGSHVDLEFKYSWFIHIESTPQWGGWGSWSSCSRTCNGGTRSRRRTCMGGFNCAGSNIDTEDCNTRRCRGNQTLIF